jgi:hypothetical protein
MSKTTQSKAAGATVKALRVVSLTGKPYRRAGFVFTPQPQLVPLADVSDEQRTALHADPHLDVIEAEVPAEQLQAEAEAGAGEAPQA